MKPLSTARIILCSAFMVNLGCVIHNIYLHLAGLRRVKAEFPFLEQISISKTLRKPKINASEVHTVIH